MSRSAVNMWIRDRLEVDSEYPQSAKQYIRQLEKSIEGLHPSQRKEAISHAREYAVLYYGERHKHTPVPSSVDARLTKLEQRVEKAERFDRAREFVQKYGPPEKALATFMRAPEREQQRQSVSTKEQPRSTVERDPGKRGKHEIPWMMHKGPVHTMTQKHLEQAQKSYEQWPHNDKRSFVEYVNITRAHWTKSPEDKQPAKQQEKSREVELSR